MAPWAERVAELALEVLRLPLKIVALGSAVVLVGWMLQKGVGLPDLKAMAGFQLSDPKQDGLRIIVAVLIFAVGIATAGFLWWLSARFFGLIQGKQLDPVSLAALKELPMGLPEGTIRAVLALVVAVVGLPLLLFSDVVGNDQAISGYINGIITGVFGFYFGTRWSRPRPPRRPTTRQRRPRPQQPKPSNSSTPHRRKPRPSSTAPTSSATSSPPPSAT
jgi:cytochrome c biogenesis protein CcdA